MKTEVKDDERIYIRRLFRENNGTRRPTLLHRLITGAGEGEKTEHQRLQGRLGQTVPKEVGSKDRGREGRQVFLGNFASPELAAVAYNEAAVKLTGSLHG
jgi:hypothetical protein